MITFTEANLTKDGINHKNALYSTIASRGKYVPMVLLDNRSRLNEYPLNMATCLTLGPEKFTPTKQTMKAYDNFKRGVIGIVFIDVTIGLTQFVIKLEVLDMLSSFNLLLGRSRIHQAMVILLTLPQKVKFSYKDTIISVHGDSNKGIITSLPILEV